MRDTNQRLAASMPTRALNGMEPLKEQAGFELYARDGHYHQASVHEPRVGGQRWPAGHFFTV